MPGGIIFFSLSHLGAQLSLLALLTGTLWQIPHRNFQTISAALPGLCWTLHVCVYKPLSLIVQTSVSSGSSAGKQNKNWKTCWENLPGLYKHVKMLIIPLPVQVQMHFGQSKIKCLLFNLFSLMSLCFSWFTAYDIFDYEVKLQKRRVQETHEITAGELNLIPKAGKSETKQKQDNMEYN